MAEKEVGEERVYQIIDHHWRKTEQKLQQGRNLEAGADTEATEESCSLGLLPLPCSACFLTEPSTSSPGRPSPNCWALHY